MAPHHIDRIHEWRLVQLAPSIPSRTKEARTHVVEDIGAGAWHREHRPRLLGENHAMARNDGRGPGHGHGLLRHLHELRHRHQRQKALEAPARMLRNGRLRRNRRRRRWRPYHHSHRSNWRRRGCGGPGSPVRAGVHCSRHQKTQQRGVLVLFSHVKRDTVSDRARGVELRLESGHKFVLKGGVFSLGQIDRA